MRKIKIQSKTNAFFLFEKMDYFPDFWTGEQLLEAILQVQQGPQDPGVYAQ